MKKIYSLLSAVVLTFTAFAQQQETIVSEKEAYKPKTKTVSVIKNQKVSTAAFSGRYDVAASLPLSHGHTINTGTVTGQEYGVYVSPIFCDSTVRKSFTTASVVSSYFIGQNFDPKSIIFNQTATPLLTNADSYYLDTVWVGGVYQRRGNNVDDTLYVNIVWGDTANTSVFTGWSYGAAPMSTFGSYYTPNYSTVAGLTGNRIQYTAPASNKLVIKHVITKADSTYLADISDYLPIPVNGALGQSIPADNILNAGFTFQAGGTHANGDISYASSTSSLPGTVSGWAAIEYAQDIPAVTTASNVTYGYDDFGTGKNTSTYIRKQGRYGLETGAFATNPRGAFYFGFWMDYSIHFTPSVTAVNELEKNGFLLGQNTPNPFSNGSSVRFQLTKDANSAVFTVTDIMGRVVSSEKVGTSTGTHTVNLGSYSAGVYYYSLNVDGKVTTKKMIVE